MNEQRPTRAEINLDNLETNFGVLRRFVDPAVKIMAVVKSDAYGHGAASCAKTLAAAGADWFGVALPEEGIELRQNNIKQPILSLGGFWRGQENLCLRERITPVVYRIDMAESLDRAARERNLIADIHVKIDTGMGRLGVRFDAVREFAESLRRFPNLRVDGLMTHFAAADECEYDKFTNEQIRKFNESANIFKELGFRPAFCDLANSPATLAHPESWENMVRIGGALYGIGKDIFPPGEIVDELRSVMTLFSEISLLKTVPKGETIGYACSFETKRNSLIATIPVGYNDGLPRALSNKGKAICKGRFAPIVGRISMDLILLDVTDIPEVSLFDEVLLLGAKDGLQISAEEIAAQTGTISYEITCGISRRVPRVFKSL